VINAQALGSNRDPRAYVFPGEKAKRPTSEASMMRLIRRMGYAEITTHGFRSSFRDWAGDATHYPRDLAEQALAHSVGNEVELAYRRSDALERRRKMMESWATFCDGGAEVLELVRTG
jgi:integrase